MIKLKDKEKEEKDRIPGLKAWPNPTQTYTNVIVNHDFEKATVYVYDILGREVQRFKADQRTIPVNMDAHAEGIYIVRVETDVKTQSIKIIRGLKKR
ncbi:MAG TPA: T9SS type A sorting domain-containing protein [Flavobacteriaceae bacterium]|nr:T9SS type A sorting domain-containing protein [Flavobacteriaceae bacterium]